MKAQLMTVSVLVLFILMLAELLIFITISSGYNSLSQAYATQASAASYRSYMFSSGREFAAISLRTALSSLAIYEGSHSANREFPVMRGSNFIANSSVYLAHLIKNSTVPNAVTYVTYNGTAPGVNIYIIGYPTDPTTLASYNLSVESASLYDVSNIVINETMPVVYQNSPYNISVKYTEHIRFNESGNVYNYTIPINASISLNGTPDLYYAQEGISRHINFGNLADLVHNVGEVQALNGTTDLFAYGTILDYGSNAVCPNSNTLVSQYVIFATDNAQNINCNGSNFGGIISYTSPSASPANYVPYLNYQLSSKFISNDITTGQPALLYGPSSSTFDISGLKSAIANGYYFASPFAPSYLDRAAGNFGNSSTDGIFTFTGNNRVVAYLESNSYITGNRINLANLTNLEWVYPTDNNSFGPVAEFDGASANYGFYKISIDNGNVVVWNGATSYSSSFIVPMYKWSLIGFSLNRTAIRVFYNGNSQLFSCYHLPFI